jgi:hypothetical protein
MASTIALLLLLVASIIGEKTLFPFHLTLLFPSVVGVFPLLVETNAKVDYLANLQETFCEDECCLKNHPNLLHSLELELLPSLANCSSTTYMSP